MGELGAAWLSAPTGGLNSLGVVAQLVGATRFVSISSLPREKVFATGVLGDERWHVVSQILRLVDGDEGVTVVDPYQSGVLEVARVWFGLGRA